MASLAKGVAGDRRRIYQSRSRTCPALGECLALKLLGGRVRTFCAKHCLGSHRPMRDHKSHVSFEFDRCSRRSATRFASVHLFLTENTTIAAPSKAIPSPATDPGRAPLLSPKHVATSTLPPPCPPNDTLLHSSSKRTPRPFTIATPPSTNPISRPIYDTVRRGNGTRQMASLNRQLRRSA